jgi:hypothetical protein
MHIYYVRAYVRVGVCVVVIRVRVEVLLAITVFLYEYILKYLCATKLTTPSSDFSSQEA